MTTAKTTNGKNLNFLFPEFKEGKVGSSRGGNDNCLFLYLFIKREKNIDEKGVIASYLDY